MIAPRLAAGEDGVSESRCADDFLSAHLLFGVYYRYSPQDRSS